MNPMVTASPAVNAASSCHFNGLVRRALSEPQTKNQAMVETARDSMGTSRPDWDSINLVHSGCVPKANIDRAVTASWADRMA
mmetsp:Transcript_26038/g.52759  ORF Transcript_26038/g.52759 Transcript_26038/m.52759 type:complete len:82 (-) Transcript_26038:741-986(-)